MISVQQGEKLNFFIFLINKGLLKKLLFLKHIQLYIFLVIQIYLSLFLKLYGAILHYMVTIRFNNLTQT